MTDGDVLMSDVAAAGGGEDRWVQCDQCQKWRRVTDESVDVESLPDTWHCALNTWNPSEASCDAVEEPSGEPVEPQEPKRALRPRKQTNMMEDDESSASDQSSDDSSVAPRRRRSRAPPSSGPRKTIAWNDAEDGTLVNAVIKHGPGQWTAMVCDGEFKEVLGKFTAQQLRNRWQRLGKQESVLQKTGLPAIPPRSRSGHASGGHAQIRASSFQVQNTTRPYLTQIFDRPPIKKKDAFESESDDEASHDEFDDFEHHLSNPAYMSFYDHRDEDVQFTMDYYLGMRELKNYLTDNFGFRQQDALEVVQRIFESPDLYTRRQVLSRSIQIHLQLHHNAPLRQGWLRQAAGMTTQALHRQQDERLLAEREQRRNKRLSTGAGGAAQPGDDSMDDEDGVDASGQPRRKRQKTYVRGPYRRHTGEGQAVDVNADVEQATNIMMRAQPKPPKPEIPKELQPSYYLRKRLEQLVKEKKTLSESSSLFPKVKRMIDAGIEILPVMHKRGDEPKDESEGQIHFTIELLKSLIPAAYAPPPPPPSTDPASATTTDAAPTSSSPSSAPTPSTPAPTPAASATAAAAAATPAAVISASNHTGATSHTSSIHTPKSMGEDVVDTESRGPVIKLKYKKVDGVKQDWLYANDDVLTNSFSTPLPNIVLRKLKQGQYSYVSPIPPSSATLSSSSSSTIPAPQFNADSSNTSSAMDIDSSNANNSAAKLINPYEEVDILAGETVD